ncbi:acylglycerol kinase, mitochondrial [Caerostris darwini]|uniref:Acylglycerol kinase, mitochondrial n=1 Tax=Caerostris darwini TaxID=1538125 RepID=A0AAV4UWX4_9ARAC|nr:acylglycerol kinase, mitochondrial [Caerostris darwini]
MSRIIKTAKLLRRNWKKSTFLFGVLAYGTSYLVERYRTFEMMRAYCEEARKYGEKPVSLMMKPKHITVILNPEANDKKANVQFEKFAAPLLHLAGFRISVFQTEKEKQAQDLMEIMSNTDAVIVAGGDGTLQEAVTGLLRRPGHEEENLPLGIIPLGKTNTVAQYLFGSKSSSSSQLMAESTMAVIRETTTNMDVFKVQFADDDKPVFGMVNFEQGIFGDVEPLVNKYWYFGALKDKYTYFKNSSKEWHPILNESLEFIAPCSGCSKCYIPPKMKEQQSSRWWHVFVPRSTQSDSTSEKIDENLATKVNEDCGKRISLPSGYSNISISTAVADQKSSIKPGSMIVKIFPEDLSKKQFMPSGLSHRKSKLEDSSGIAKVIEAREVIIKTETSVKDSIQNELALNVSTEEPSVILNEPVSLQSNDSIAVSPVEDESAVSISSPISSVKAASTIQNESSSSLLVQSNDSDSVTEKPNQVNSTSSSKMEDKQHEVVSYIDKEKYKRTSCIISILPKQVTIYA